MRAFLCACVRNVAHPTLLISDDDDVNSKASSVEHINAACLTLQPQRRTIRPRIICWCNESVLLLARFLHSFFLFRQWASRERLAKEQWEEHRGNSLSFLGGKESFLRLPFFLSPIR